jgi:dihydrofolate synthase/folylpolyglutamate synthase
MELRTLADAERYLDGFLNLERRSHFDYERLGLARVRGLLDAIGNPERGLPCIHVAGSKGKGSTSLLAEALLVAAGRRAGTFTSPHLVSWRERFRVGGVELEEAELVSALADLVPAVERLRSDPDRVPSFFDLVTALALHAFRRAGAGLAVMEVGLGGRLDSTNAVESCVSVLTAIQLEHTDKLGSTLEAIAREKAGILRPYVQLLHGPLAPEALGAVLARATAVDAPVEEVRAKLVEQSERGVALALEDGRQLRVAALGAPQATNAALAVRAVEHALGRRLGPSELAALEQVRLPARIERFGDVVLDSAHTPDSARALAETLAALWPARGCVLVAAISRDKDAAGILHELGFARACVLTSAESQRSADPRELEPLAWASGIETVESAPTPAAALARARELARPGELVVVTGSIFLAGALRPLLAGAPRPLVG